MVVVLSLIEKTVCEDSRLQEMITFNFYDYKRKHFEVIRYFRKRKDTKKYVET